MCSLDFERKPAVDWYWGPTSEVRAVLEALAEAGIVGLQVDGLLHVSALGEEYFARDRSGLRMLGRNSGRVYKLGDKLRVKVVNVSLDDRRVDFELAAEPAAARRNRRTRRGERRRP